MRNNPLDSNPDSIDLYATILHFSAKSSHSRLLLRFQRARMNSSYNTSVSTIALPSNSKMQFPKVNLAYNFEAMQDLLIELYDPIAKVVIATGNTNLVYVSRQKPEGMQMPLMNHEGVQIALLKLKSDNTNDKEEMREEYTFFVSWQLQQSCFKSFLCFAEENYSMRVTKLKFNEEFLAFNIEQATKKNGEIKFTFKSNFRDLCFGREVTKIVFQLEKTVEDETVIIAQMRTTVKELRQNVQVSKQNQSISGKLTKEGVGLRSSINLSINFQMITAYKFSDYIRSKMEFYLMIGIDYTQSNIHYNDPKSLHYIPKNGRSLYQKAASGIVNILMQYDNDKLVPTYGFGAIPRIPNYPRNNTVSNCFPINGRQNDPNLVNTKGVLERMAAVLPQLEFSAPTEYGGVIKKAIEQAQSMKINMKGYVVLLILTDGLNKDMDEMTNMIVKASQLPLSIIIVGIGKNQQALKLKSFQDKNKLMDYEERRPKRSIVQFVQFEEVQENDIKLAEKTMAVVKEQIEEYHLLFGLTPKTYDVPYSWAGNVKL